MTEWLTDDQLAAWRGLWQMTDRLRETLNRDLMTRHHMSLADYEVLGRLAEASPGARVRDLTETLAWEQSRISHQVRRLTQAGLVAREDCAEDRRASIYSLTDQGRAALTAAAPDHVEAVRRVFIDHASPSTLKALRELADLVNKTTNDHPSPPIDPDPR